MALGLRKARAKRDHSKREEYSLNFLQRFTTYQIETRPIVYISLQVLSAIVELVACIVYFLAMENPPVHPEGDQLAFSFIQYSFTREYVIVFGVLGMYFLAQFILLIIVSDHRLGLLLSGDFVIFLLTAVPMIAMFINAEVREGEISSTFWSPIFLRSWYTWKFVAKIIRHLRISSAVKEIIAETVLLSVILINSAGFYQATEVIQEGMLRPLDSVLYFIIATITTMGYGEQLLIPQARLTYIVVVVVIFVAMIYLPVMINKFTELAAYLQSRNRYRKSLPHVVVLGTFSVSEVKLLFGEFMAGMRKFTPLNLVLVSPTEFDPGVVSLMTQPRYRERVTLCVSSMSLGTDELERFQTRKAYAVFIMSSRSATGERGDYEALLKSIAFHRHDRDLPQYLTLKRAMHRSVAERTAFALIEREKIKYQLMGVALQLPGFIPMLLNLIKTFETPTPTDCEWYDEYQSGMSNSIFSVVCPPSLEGRPFKSVALILLLRCSMTTLGVIHEATGNFELNPDAHQLKGADELVVIARGRNALLRLDDELGAGNRMDYQFSQFQGGGKNGKGLQGGGGMNPTPPTSMPSFVRTLDQEPVRLIRSSQSTLKRNNCYPFDDHILLIDMSCFQTTETICKEEEISSEGFQKTDLMNLLQIFFERKAQAIVFLSRNDLGEPFEQGWPSDMLPLYHIRGAGTDVGALERCNVPRAKAVLIFTSLEGQSAAGDSVVMLAQRMVYARLVEAGRQNDVPVLTEFDDYACIPSCEPRYPSALAAKLAESSGSEDYYVAPVFIVGGAITSAMLDTVMYQAYYNPVVPHVVEQLLYHPDHPHLVMPLVVADFFPDMLVTGSEYCYADIFRHLTQSHRLPLGLFRVIDSGELGENLLGYRYFFTNPLPSTPLKTTDAVYVIQMKDEQ